jgi:superfamily II DNA or RNA helicase
LFGTSSILSTGINIKNLHHLFLTSGGKSSIKLNQSIGRLLRLHASKNTVNIWDIIDDLTIQMKSTLHKNYFFKHFEERLAEYMDNEYEIDEKVIQL